MQVAIPMLEKRIKELEAFDINLIKERSGPETSSLEMKVNDTLSLVFGYDTVEYNRYRANLDRGPWIMGEPLPLREVKQYYQEGINHAISNLKTIIDLFKERVDLSPISDTPGSSTSEKSLQRTPGNKVFIVHGHDETAKQTTARFLERLGLEAVILHEQAGGGRTIVEELEYYSTVDFAVILLTPDDLGADKLKKESLNPRARQNVILELGFFVGKIGRERVCPLTSGSLDLPSDILGVEYIPMDSHGAWKYRLGKELQAAGFQVDLNKI
jgi:predicted nucleotide-binding protein